MEQPTKDVPTKSSHTTSPAHILDADDHPIPSKLQQPMLPFPGTDIPGKDQVVPLFISDIEINSSSFQIHHPYEGAKAAHTKQPIITPFSKIEDRAKLYDDGMNHTNLFIHNDHVPTHIAPVMTSPILGPQTGRVSAVQINDGKTDIGSVTLTREYEIWDGDDKRQSDEELRDDEEDCLIKPGRRDDPWFDIKQRELRKKTWVGVDGWMGGWVEGCVEGGCWVGF